MDIIEPSQEITYPEKPLPAKEGNVIMRSVISVVLFVAAFYYFFHYDLKFIFILLGVLLIHELGHFFAMKFFNYKDLGIFFIPLVGAIASGTKDEVSQRQRTIILFAGPLPGILIGSVLYYIGKLNFDFEMIRVANVFLFLNLFNLLPVYPLDGGQLVRNLFFKTGNIITMVFLVLSMAAFTWFSVVKEQYQLLVIPFLLLMQLINERKIADLKKKLVAEGFDLNKSFDDLSNEEYWKMRDHLADHNLYRRYVERGNYTVSSKESSIISYIKLLLVARPLIEDMSPRSKTLTVLLWILCFALAFWLGVASPYIQLVVQ